jgi:hypothetical protein
MQISAHMLHSILLQCCHFLQHISINDRIVIIVIGELQVRWVFDGSCFSLFEAPFQHLHGRTKGNHENPHQNI